MIIDDDVNKQLDLNEISTLQKRRKKVKIKRKKKVVINRIVKCKLKTILKNQNWFPHIKNMVKIVNMVKTESYFFFNQYILYLLANNKNIKFDKTTIERSTLFVLNMQDSIRYKDDEFNNLNEVYNNSYKILGKNKILEYANIKSINNPFNYMSVEIMTNIINHINLHFFKFQKLYIKTFVYDEFLKYKFKKSVLCSIISCILYNINNKTDALIIKSKKLQNNEKLNEITPKLDQLIKKFKEEIPLSIRENISNSNLKKNYGDVLKYYYKMIKYLEDNNKKRFSLLPQLTLKMSYVKFDSRMISTIYDNFKLKKDKVGIKYFESNYKKFYKECFNFSKFKYSRIGNPISFSTNGYSVCVNFELEKELEDNNELDINQENDEIIEQKENTKKKKKDIIIDFNEINKDKKFKRGLFDSDNCIASSETLDKYHKIGIDPGNKTLLYCVSETGKKIEISKGYYNEISHITVNNLKNKNRIKEDNMTEIYNKLSDTGYKKTIKLEVYNKYIKVMRDNWDQIYNFYGKNNFQKLELDTFINKKKALHKIVRKLVPKNNKKHNFKEKDKIICSNADYNDIIKKPVMLVFGKGNGNITISSLKNSGKLSYIIHIICSINTSFKRRIYRAYYMNYITKLTAIF